MTWSATQGSAIFRAYLTDAVGPTASFTPHLASGGTWKAALYGNGGTPDKDATSANTAYNAGAWVTANQSGATDTNWPAAGVALVFTGVGATRFNNSAGGITTFRADNTTGAGNVTVTAYGDLVYDDALTAPVVDQGIAFHFFGASGASVTAGTFTIQWSSNRIVEWTHATG